MRGVAWSILPPLLLSWLASIPIPFIIVAMEIVMLITVTQGVAVVSVESAYTAELLEECKYRSARTLTEGNTLHMYCQPSEVGFLVQKIHDFEWKKSV